LVRLLANRHQSNQMVKEAVNLNPASFKTTP